jgi:hypothetical protein
LAIFPGAAKKIATKAAFKTFFLDAAHFKLAKGDTAYDAAQLIVIETKSSVFSTRISGIGSKPEITTKNVPLAMSICLGETKAEYAFLLWCVGLGGFDLNDPNICMISDRGKAVLAAVERCLPRADGFFCNVHLWRNLNAEPGAFEAKRSEAVRQNFFSMSVASNQNWYLKSREVLFALLTDKGKAYLSAIEEASYCALKFREKTGKSISFYNSNPVEAENFRQMDARWAMSPVQATLSILQKWSEVIASHQKLIIQATTGLVRGEGHSVIYPPLINYIREQSRAFQESQKLVATTVDAFEWTFVVRSIEDDNKQYKVDLKTRSCTCGIYNERLFPCSHALSAFGACKRFDASCTFASLCDPIYRLDNMTLGYARPINPVFRESLVPMSQPGMLLPSIHFQGHGPRSRGRPPKVQRFASRGDDKKSGSNPNKPPPKKKNRHEKDPWTSDGMDDYANYCGEDAFDDHDENIDEVDLNAVTGNDDGDEADLVPNDSEVYKLLESLRGDD